MSDKTLITIGAVVGGFVGSYAPVLVGAFSFTSLIGGGIGGVLGIWLMYRLVRG